MTDHPATRTSASRTTDDVGSDAAEELVQRHPQLVRVARVGWAAKGIVYLLTGVLAFSVARGSAQGDQGGSGDEQADPSGAVAAIARQPYGAVLMWVLTAGLLVYALWRFVTVILPAGTDEHALLRRAGYTLSGATYVALGLTTLALARDPGTSGNGQGGQDARVSSATETVLGWTGGRLLVGAAGLVVVGVAGYFLWKGVTASFERELEHRPVGPISWDVVRTMGRAGWVGRAAMMALIGVFVTRAAILFEPDEAGGLDDSLRRVADSTVGTVLVFVVAIGLVLYGAFCVITTPSRKLVASDDDAVA